MVTEAMSLCPLSTIAASTRLFCYVLFLILRIYVSHWMLVYFGPSKARYRPDLLLSSRLKLRGFRNQNGLKLFQKHVKTLSQPVMSWADGVVLDYCPSILKRYCNTFKSPHRRQNLCPQFLNHRLLQPPLWTLLYSTRPY